jgi:TolB-like protein/cytochrome c-type biogenesis protein CcmH/NrfG
MDTINAIFEWLEAREAVFSALAALAAIIGISYGILAFVFPAFGRKVKKLFGHEEPGQAVVKITTDDSQDRSLPEGPPSEVTKSSIAVLPLRTLSTNEEDRNMAAGISSEINADLAQVPDLRVASHLATFAFQGENIDLREIADVLKIHYVLTGSFQRAGDRIRLMAELTDAHTQEQLWASTYDRELKDLFTVQAEVSAAIVGAIGGELKLADTRIAFEAPTQQLDAWGLVQKAYNFWLTRFTPEDYDKSVTLLRKAIGLDPKYAGARASLAMILSQRALDGLSQDFEKDVLEALEMAEEAVRLEPNDLTVLESAGLVWTHRGYGLRAREVLRRAVDLAPLDLIAWGYLGFNLGLTGGDEEAGEAVEILDRLLDVAPRHPSIPYWKFFRSAAFMNLGDLDKAEQDSHDVLKIQPAYYLSWWVLANTHGRKGEQEKALDAMQQAQAINPLLTAQHFAQNLRTICMSDEAAGPFTVGLKRAGLIE